MPRWGGHEGAAPGAGLGTRTYVCVCAATYTERREAVHLNTTRKGTGGSTCERVTIPGDYNDTFFMHALR